MNEFPKITTVDEAISAVLDEDEESAAEESSTESTSKTYWEEFSNICASEENIISIKVANDFPNSLSMGIPIKSFSNLSNSIQTSTSSTNKERDNFSFVVLEIDDDKKRLEIESKIISTVSLCEECCASKDWLGLSSPKEKIRKSGLWIVNELYKEPLNEDDFEELKKNVSQK